MYPYNTVRTSTVTIHSPERTRSVKCIITVAAASAPMTEAPANMPTSPMVLTSAIAAVEGSIHTADANTTDLNTADASTTDIPTTDIKAI